MRTVGIVLCGLLIAVAWTGGVQAQDEIMAEIQRTTTPPVIDGMGDDAVWAAATPHGDDEFLTVSGVEPDDEEDLSVVWKALWDDDNLYVMMEVTDEFIVNDSNCNYQDDSPELYIDAQNIDTDNFNPNELPGEPAYQFTAIAGNGPDGFCGVPTDTSAFSAGINSYDGDDDLTQYPQGADTSVTLILDETHYTFEGAFPWEALEETPANILARGDMGFGVAVNDTDNPGDRDTQVMWATESPDLWNRSDNFPSVALSTETVGGGGKPALQAGDSDEDLDFDQFDLIMVQVAAKYLTGEAANWGEGDWNGAPGGEQGAPPAGNGFFDQIDIIAALGTGNYLNGPYAAIATGGERNDAQTSIVYDANNGEVAVDAPAGMQLTSINIDSAAGIFTGDPAQSLGGSFDNDDDNNVFKATFGSEFGSLSFGTVAQAGLSEDFLAGDLSVVGSLAGGGGLGDVDLIYIPEPSTMVLLAMGLFVGLASRRRNR